MYLSIIIPAYNEEKRIIPAIENTLEYLKKQDFESEILVVSDGSVDNTKEVVEGFKSTEKTKIRFLEYFPNRGKGYAVKYGMQKGVGDYILFMDADYSVPIEYFEAGMKLINSGFDIAIASRAHEESDVANHQKFFRELSGKIYTLIQNLYLGLRFKDTQCGFKLFTKKAAHELFAKQKLNSVIFDPEILWLGKKNGYRISDFPVKWEHQEDSRIVYDSIGKSLSVFKELFRIRMLH